VRALVFTRVSRRRVDTVSDCVPPILCSLSLLREPGEYLTCLKDAVDDLISGIDGKYLESGEVHITLTGG